MKNFHKKPRDFLETFTEVSRAQAYGYYTFFLVKSKKLLLTPNEILRSYLALVKCNQLIRGCSLVMVDCYSRIRIAMHTRC